MSTVIVKGVVRNGRVELQQPLDLPDGAEVEVHAVGTDLPVTLEERATLTRIDEFEPVEWTDEERAVWEAERQARKERAKAEAAARHERLRSIGE
jgi:hypothetical protein